ncbi:uncharacterized protein LOC110876327 [Helianthus annuus]|uniref:uncharacterized protein LOC110876327 n=1 Tax=Helianthus annuus TaxID=4232 RepID=UPI000B8F7945|nr:uncharacterized protein LOC110876327 [Helianthus annuus]
MATFKGPEPSVQKENSVTRPRSNTHKTEKTHCSSTKSEQSIKKTEFHDSKKGCTCKYFVSCKPRDFTGEIGAIDALKWLDEIETVVDISGYAAKDTVKFASQSFKEDALTWWKALIQSTGKVEMYSLSWSKFVELIRETYCPPHEVEKVETDFLKLTMKGLKCRACLSEYNSLSRLVPYLITPESKRIAWFIGGLAPEIKGMVKSSKPTTYRSVVDLALSLTEDEIRARAMKSEEDHKRKRDDTPNKDFKKGKTGSNCNQSKPNEAKPKCKTCGKQHFGKCFHEHTKGCGEKGHIKTRCPKRTTDRRNKATDGQKGNV